METELLCQIDKHFVQVTDHRVDRGTNYDLVEMILIALTATMCGAQGWTEIERFAMAKLEWFERLISLRKGVGTSAENSTTPAGTSKPSQAFVSFFPW